MNIPDYVDVVIPVAVGPEGAWTADADFSTALQDSMADVVRSLGHRTEDVPLHVYLLKARLRIPSGKVVKAKVDEPLQAEKEGTDGR